MNNLWLVSTLVPYCLLQRNTARVFVSSLRMQQRVEDLRSSGEKPRQNRPGYNTYLKVLFNGDSLLSDLHQTITQIKDEFASDVLVDGSDPEPLISRSDSQPALPSGVPLKIQPRSLASLHMTLFFGGETICSDLSAEELENWYMSVSKRVQQSNFRTAKNLDRTEPPLATDEYWFRFKALRTFPPKRNYLIVAEYEASPAWHDLHDDLRSIAAASESQALRQITQRSKSQWTPHITLANLRGSIGKKKLAQRLSELSNEKKSLDQRWVASGIGLGGPIPTQVEHLDWDFLYHGGLAESFGQSIK